MTNAEKYGVIADRHRNLYAIQVPGMAPAVFFKGCFEVGSELAHSDIPVADIDFSEVNELEAGLIRVALQTRTKRMNLERSFGYDSIQRR